MPPKGVGTKSSTARRIKPGQKTPCILHLDSLSGAQAALAGVCRWHPARWPCAPSCSA